MFEFIPKEFRGIGSGLVKAAVIVFVIIYIISPIDLMPGIPIDDILVALVGLSFIGIDIKKVFGIARSAKQTNQASKKKKK